MDPELEPDFGPDELEAALLHTNSGLAAGVTEASDDEDADYQTQVLAKAAARLQVSRVSPAEVEPAVEPVAEKPAAEDSSVPAQPPLTAEAAVAKMVQNENESRAEILRYEAKEPCVSQRSRIRKRKKLEGPNPTSHVDQGYEIPMWHPFNQQREEARYASYKKPWPTEAINEFRREVWQPEGFTGTLDDLERVVDYRLAWHLGAIGAKVMLMSGRHQVPVYITIDGTDCDSFLRIQTKPMVVLPASELWDLRYDGIRNALHLLNEEAQRKCSYAYKLVKGNHVRRIKRPSEALREPEEPPDAAPIREHVKTVRKYDIHDVHHVITDRLAAVGKTATGPRQNTSHVIASSESDSSGDAIAPKLTAFEKELLDWAGTTDEVSEDGLRAWVERRTESGDSRRLLAWLDWRYDVRALAPTGKVDRGLALIKDLKDYVLAVSQERDLLGPPDQGMAVAWQRPSPTMLDAAVKEKPRAAKLHLAPTRFIEAVLVLIWESRVQTALLKYFQ